MASGNPQLAARQLYESNPQFRELADRVQGMTPEQAFQSMGLDFNQFRGFGPYR